MNVHEIMRLQGINPTTFNQVVSTAEMGKQLGNAMSVNVIERILYKVLVATTLGDKLLQQSDAGREPLQEDRWQSGQAFKDLASTVDPDYEFDKMRLPKKRVVKKILATSPAMRECIVDSGASIHIIARRSLTKSERKKI